MPDTRFEEQHKELLPVLAAAFSELGYHRATTAELARRCGVRENILYRHWPDKPGMFVAALDHVLDLTITTWSRIAAAGRASESAARLLDHESEHLGEFGNYRLLFSALGETSHPAIGAALKRVYRRLFRFIEDRVRDARGNRERAPEIPIVAWSILGIGTMATIGRELGLVSKRLHRDLVADGGRCLLGE